LDWFTHEKVAETPDPLKDVGSRYQIPREIDPESIDPGERALAGILSVAGSVSAKATPLVGRMIGRGVLGRSAEDWFGPPIQGVSSLKDAQGVMFDRLDRPAKIQNRVLGLFDIDQTHPRAQTREYADKINRQFEHLDDLRDTVDGFINKHDLPGKGVRINLQKGPVSGLGGGSYHIPTKEVYLPHLGTEVALHELGHAADYSTRVGKVRGIVEPILSKGVLTALPIALAAGDHIKEMIPGTVDDKAIGFMQDHAPEIMAATLAATSLYPEAKASITAIRHIRDLERLGQQPVGATVRAVKRLTPLFGSYLLGAVPAVVGMVLARKYMNEARDEKRELQDGALREFQKLEKSAGVVSGLRAIGDVGSQIGRGAIDLMRQPHTLRRIGQSAKDVGTSPEFIHGALGAAVPATLGALYMYGTPGGEEVRSRLHPETRDRLLKHRPANIGLAAKTDEQWRSEHPMRFAGLVAMGAALSGGIMSRFLHDLTRVL
jgi:hypothetical protein